MTLSTRGLALMTATKAGDDTLPVSAVPFGGCCGRSSMVELQPSKLVMRVRFPSPALFRSSSPAYFDQSFG